MEEADRAIAKATTDRAEASAAMSQEGLLERERAHIAQSFSTASNMFWEAHSAKRRLNDRHEERKKALAA
eukprot:6022426-Heterocapsa_arctica.AAC.1